MTENTILDLLTRFASRIAAYLFGAPVDGITDAHLGL